MASAVGMMFDYRALGPADVAECARRCESAGIAELWMVEDCFYSASIGLAAAALTATDELSVGIGVMAAVTRNPAIIAMELATLAGIGPGRIVPGIGHGLPEWMDQIGARSTTPLATLEETISSVKRLLDGDEVTLEGHSVYLDHVRLDQPPAIVPPVLSGVQRPRSLASAGRVADGVVLSDAGPTYVDWALEHAGRPDDFRVVTLTVASVARDRREAHRAVCGHVAELVRAEWPSYTVLPFFDELTSRVTDDGPEALLGMPTDYWHQIGAFGTVDDARAHLAALGRSGVDVAVVYPGTPFDDPWDQLDLVTALADA
jgi:5,10-methylenetetrahydromethanopterin reductase